MHGQDETGPAPKRPRLENHETEPAHKQPRLDYAGSSSGSRPYIPSDSNWPCNEARNSFTGHGVQNSGGTIEIARDMITNNYGPTTQRQGGHDVLEERRRALLESLQFAQMDSRQMTIKQAHARTCRWFLKDPEYLQWSKNDGTESQGSFLWIKGKPGAGKSTLMKFLLKQTRRTRSEGIIISFFFNARGEDMEKTTLGLYQSLLVQLLEVRPSLQRILDRFRNFQPKWTVELLEELFEEAIEGLDETSLVCFIDALDECQEQEVRDMIRFLSELSDAKTRFRVCFASRHYPHITIPKGRSIVLENKDEHHEDIAKYLDNALRIGTGRLSEQIRSELQEKASGVFMWVVLVVHILNKECDTGQKHTLRNRLRQIPGDLHALFRDILTRDTRNAPGLLLCIQWVLFARRPLSPRQLYYAVLAGVEPESLADCHTAEIINDDISKFILDKSKGLAESTKSKLPTIQFIHESVRDFLLKDNGLQMIWQGDSANLEGRSQDTLKRACFTYMTCKHVSYDIEATVLPKSPSRKEDTDRRNDIDGRFPFLEYATQAVLYHADKAEYGKQSQTDFLAAFPLAGWVKRYNIFEEDDSRRFTSDVSLLYVLAHENRGALISIQQEYHSCFHEEPERYKTPLFAALSLKCTSAVNALLELQKRRYILRPLLPYFDMPTSPEEAWYTVFNRNLRLTETQSVLAFLSKIQDGKLLGMFCATEVVEVGTRDRQGRLPLSYVAAGKYVKWAESLLERGADINSADSTRSRRGKGMTPLHHASDRGSPEMVEFLIDRGARLCAIDDNGWTPFHYATRRGNNAIVKFLLKIGANVAISTKHGLTPLHEASRGGHIEVVALLIETGADINATKAGKITPLFHASQGGRTEVAKLLIEKGADVNAATSIGRTPLSWASFGGHIETVMLLLEKGANINTSDTFGWTPLYRAVANGYKEVVKLLIEKGADVEAADNHGRTPLFGASEEGRIEIVRMLLEKGADVNAAGYDGRTPLLGVNSTWPIEIITMLLEKGANVNASDRTGHTPLKSAMMFGNEEVVKLLEEWGARPVSDGVDRVT